MYLVLIIIFLAKEILARDNLQIAYRWKMLNFAFHRQSDKLQALQTNEFIPEHNWPFGFDVYEDRLFITIPKLKRGVITSLAYIKLSEAKMESPPLHPYPNWHSHKEIRSAISVRVDKCRRLWILDSGVVTDTENVRRQFPPRVLIYNLMNDQLLQSYTIPDSQRPENSTFVNMAVEDNQCQDSFAYLANTDRSEMVVYSYRQNRSWLVKHHFFHINPLAGNFAIGKLKFNWDAGLLGLALSGADQEGYSRLYFHPLVSFDEFSVNTRVLRDEKLATNQTLNFGEFRRLGGRGPKGESGASFIDKRSKILFFSSLNHNGISCWRTTDSDYDKSHGIVFSNETMAFPNDIKVDAEGRLWVLSNNLHLFLRNIFRYHEYNFVIFNGNVSDVIENTPCAPKLGLLSHLSLSSIQSSSSSGERPICEILTVVILLCLSFR